MQTKLNRWNGVSFVILGPVLTALLVSLVRASLSSLGTLSTRGFMPHRMCLSESAGLLWTMATSDEITAISYLFIPALLIRVFRHGVIIEPADTNRIRDLSGLLIWFSAFIVSCALTHQMDVITLWFPFYYVDCFLRVITSLSSLGTCVALYRSLPLLFGLTNIAELSRQVERLAAQVLQFKEFAKSIAPEEGK